MATVHTSPVEAGAPPRAVGATERGPQRLIGAATRWGQRHPMRADVLLATFLAVLSVLGVVTSDVDPLVNREADALGVLLATTIHLPLMFRRVRPVEVLAVVAASTWAFWTLDYATAFDAGILVALYSTTRYVEERAVAWGAGGAVAAISVGWIIAGLISDEHDIGVAVLLGSGSMVAISLVLGDNMRHRRAYQAELEAKAARTEREAANEARRAAADERNRIARELHDVVAHSMSVMVVQAGAARRVLDADPTQASKALAAIEDIGRSSLTDMRRVLGVLRDPDAARELAPQPTLDDLDQVIDRCRRAGLDVDLAVEGAARPLPSAVQLAVFRIVQEALTNVVKHARASSVRVTIAYGPDQVEVEVADDGVGGSPAAPGGGNGIIGMRERVEIFGGDLRAGPRPFGGFSVSARLPTAAIAESPDQPTGAPAAT